MIEYNTLKYQTNMKREILNVKQIIKAVMRDVLYIANAITK